MAAAIGSTPPTAGYATHIESLDSAAHVVEKGAGFVHSRLLRSYTYDKISRTLGECKWYLKRIRAEKKRLHSFRLVYGTGASGFVDFCDPTAKKTTKTLSQLYSVEAGISRMQQMLTIAKLIRKHHKFYIAEELFTFPELHQKFVWEGLISGTHISRGGFGEVCDVFSDKLSLVVKKALQKNKGVSLSESKHYQMISTMVNEIAILLFLETKKKDFIRPVGVACTLKEGRLTSLSLYLEKGQCSLLSIIQTGSYTDVNVRAWMYDILQQFHDIHTVLVPAKDGPARLGLVHGDAKLDNLVVMHDGRVRLVDFGNTAPVGSKRNPGTTLTDPPEYLWNKIKKLDPSQDIWSIGCILYSMLTKKHLMTKSEIFEGKILDQAFIDEKITLVIKRSPSPLFKKLGIMAQQCLRVSPEERPTTKALLENKLFSRFTKTSAPEMSPHAPDHSPDPAPDGGGAAASAAASSAGAAHQADA